MTVGHVGINIPDLVAGKAYYDELMPALGYEPLVASADEFAYRPADSARGPFLFFYPSLEPGDYSRHRVGLQHMAFTVRLRSSVRSVHELVLRLGQTVLHEPQEFPQYHPQYYATFWLDPFGLMLEAVCHRDPASRS
jgi:catechol 2,3-dioxygenase-like lactoylglutathione lyase family enzyme